MIKICIHSLVIFSKKYPWHWIPGAKKPNEIWSLFLCYLIRKDRNETSKSGKVLGLLSLGLSCGTIGSYQGELESLEEKVRRGF